MPLAGEAASGVVATVPLTALLAGLTQQLVEPTALSLVEPDVAVDGLVADPELARPPEPSSDLLRAPMLWMAKAAV